MGRGKRVVCTAGLMFAGGAVAAPAANAAPWPHITNNVTATPDNVTGTWRLHTNDCFFGVCNYSLHLVQTGHAITSTNNTTSSFISGSVHTAHITVNFNGVSPEDDWTCAGHLNAARTFFHGTFTDGTGGSGTCRAVLQAG